MGLKTLTSASGSVVLALVLAGASGECWNEKALLFSSADHPGFANLGDIPDLGSRYSANFWMYAAEGAFNRTQNNANIVTNVAHFMITVNIRNHIQLYLHTNGRSGSWNRVAWCQLQHNFFEKWSNIGFLKENCVARIIIDGVVCDEETFSSAGPLCSAISNGNQPITVGSCMQERYRCGLRNVEFANLQLWDTALSVAQMNNFAVRTPIGAAGLVRYWKFNDGSGERILESTTNGLASGRLVTFGGLNWVNTSTNPAWQGSCPTSTVSVSTTENNINELSRLLENVSGPLGEALNVTRDELRILQQDYSTTKAELVATQQDVQAANDRIALLESALQNVVDGLSGDIPTTPTTTVPATIHCVGDSHELPAIQADSSGMQLKLCHGNLSIHTAVCDMDPCSVQERVSNLERRFDFLK